MKYILDERYRLRGWQNAHTGIYDTAMKTPRFFPKDLFLLLMRCDGAHDLDESRLSEREKKLLADVKKAGMIRPAGFAEFLRQEQEYKVYPAPYKQWVHWSVTGACNLKCRHCFMSAPHAKHGAPTFGQLIAIADQLAECGVFRAGITGGEPLIREDFLDIIDALNEREIGVDTIYTNGWLVDEAFLDALDKRHVHPSFQLSYDGVGWHDFLRGVPGAEERTLRALKRLQERKHPVSVSMSMHRKNRHVLRESVNLMASLGVGVMKCGSLLELGEWARPELRDLRLTKEEELEMLEAYIPQYFEDDAPLSVVLLDIFRYSPGAPRWEMINRRECSPEEEARTLACGVSPTFFYIGAEGMVCPGMGMADCGYAKNFQNLFGTPLKDILSGERFTALYCANVGEIRDHNPKCRTCAYVDRCIGGSRTAALTGILNAGFSRVFLDKLLTGREPTWFVPFMIGLGLLTLIQLAAAWIQAVYTLRINGKMAVVGNSTYIWKILRLPMEFFSQRMAGDIQQRKNANASIAGEIVNTLAPLALNTVMMIFYLVVMIRYSWLLTLVGVASVLCQLGISRLISRKRVNITRVMMRDSGKLAAATVSGVEMIETIKASGAENGFFEKWSGYQASVNTQNVRYQRLDQYLGMIPGVISGIMNVTVLILGVWLTMRGQFTTGMIFAFQGFLSAFIAPAGQLISSGQQMQEMRSSMERIEDVMEYPDDSGLDEYGEEDPSLPGQAIGAGETLREMHGDTGRINDVMDAPADAMPAAEGEAESYDKLSGELSMRHVTFGYSRLEPPLIEDFSLELKQGQQVAFVGFSGCGKSTLAKLISGLYQPWSGEILFDGKPARQIHRSVFTGSVAVVDQDITLFEDTIANNIKMWDSSIENYEMIVAARDAQIHEDIMQREGGYQYRITEGGKDFSGGQRQRLLIARAIAPKPKILMFDEATSALDNVTQKQVSESLDRMKCTRIVIAHRLSTIRQCDRIIVLDGGHIIEDGTYEELIEKNGFFAELVERQRLDQTA